MQRPRPDVNTKPPNDEYHMVYLILLMHGIGILMPWNMFITARSYFVDYKLSKDYTGQDTNYVTYFLSYVGFASHIPNLIFNWVNLFMNKGFRGSITARIVPSICIEMFIFVVTIVLASTDSKRWSSIFFWSTMVSIIILNMASGIYQNIVFEVAAKLPSKYPGAILLGCVSLSTPLWGDAPENKVPDKTLSSVPQNISGTLVSLTELITIAIAPEIKAAAIYYFSTALFVLLVCLATYFILPCTNFYAYYELLKKTLIHSRTNERTENANKFPYWLIFKKASFQLFNVFFVFFVTLSVFPAMQADIKKCDSEFFVPERYYENILCFLTFNMAAMLGSLISNWIDWPDPKALFLPVTLRALFIPFFFFCNFQPTNKIRRVPVLIPNDWVYWLGSIGLGISSGFLSCKAIMYTTMSVESTYASIAGMFGGATIVTGVFLGVLFSMAFPLLAEV